MRCPCDEDILLMIIINTRFHSLQDLYDSIIKDNISQGSLILNIMCIVIVYSYLSDRMVDSKVTIFNLSIIHYQIILRVSNHDCSYPVSHYLIHSDTAVHCKVHDDSNYYHLLLLYLVYSIAQSYQFLILTVQQNCVALICLI